MTVPLDECPVRMDRQGITHIGWNWTDDWWEAYCDAYQVSSLRDTDELKGTAVTCLQCWATVIRVRTP